MVFLLFNSRFFSSPNLKSIELSANVRIRTGCNANESSSSMNFPGTTCLRRSKAEVMQNSTHNGNKTVITLAILDGSTENLFCNNKLIGVNNDFIW